MVLLVGQWGFPTQIARLSSKNSNLLLIVVRANGNLYRHSIRIYSLQGILLAKLAQELDCYLL
jgi:hypothetical protein